MDFQKTSFFPTNPKWSDMYRKNLLILQNDSSLSLNIITILFMLIPRKFSKHYFIQNPITDPYVCGRHNWVSSSIRSRYIYVSLLEDAGRGGSCALFECIAGHQKFGNTCCSNWHQTSSGRPRRVSTAYCVWSKSSNYSVTSRLRNSTGIIVSCISQVLEI